jgi:glycosyltransferase involved in cell wall biosynthesis
MDVILTSSSAIPHIGGLSTHFQLLERHLLRRGHSVRTVVKKPDPTAFRLITRILGRDRSRTELLLATVRTLAQHIQDTCQRTRPDLIHSHDAIATCAAVRAVGDTVPIVQTVHGPLSREARTGSAARCKRYMSTLIDLERKAYQRVRRLISVDNGQAQILRSDFGVARERIVVISNAIDVEAVRSLATEQSDGAPSFPYFIAPRRLVPKNGLETALAAMARLADSPAHLLLAGDGPLKPNLQRLADDLSISSRVHFLGGLSHKSLMPLIAKSIALIVPSMPVDGVVEATSLSLLEGMACGAPAIASNIGGLAEIVDHGRTGFLVPAGDGRELASVMSFVAHMEPMSRNRLVTSALDSVKAAFGVDQWLDAILDVYTETAVRSQYV